MGKLIDIAIAANYDDDIIERVADFTQNPEFNDYLSMPYREVMEQEKDRSVFITAPMYRLKDESCSFIQSFVKADIISIEKLFQSLTDMFSRRINEHSSSISKCKMTGLRPDFNQYMKDPKSLLSKEDDEHFRSMLAMFQMQLYRKDGRGSLFYLYKDATDVWRHNPLCVMIQNAIKKLNLFEQSDFVLGFPGIKRYVLSNDVTDLYLVRMMEVQATNSIQKDDKIYDDYVTIFHFLVLACLKAFDKYQGEESLDNKTYNALITLVSFSAVFVGVPFFAHYFSIQIKAIRGGITFNKDDSLIHDALISESGFTPLMDVIDIAGFRFGISEHGGRILYPADGDWIDDSIITNIDSLCDFIEDNREGIYAILTKASKAKAVDMLTLSVHHYLQVMTGISVFFEPHKDYLTETYSQFIPVYLIAKLIGADEANEFESIAPLFSMEHLSSEDQALCDLITSATAVDKDTCYAYLGHFVLKVKESADPYYEVVRTLTPHIAEMSGGDTKVYLEQLKVKSGEAVLEGDADLITEIASQVKALKESQTQLLSEIKSNFSFKGQELVQLRANLERLISHKNPVEAGESESSESDSKGDDNAQVEEVQRLQDELQAMRSEVDKLTAENGSLNLALSHASTPIAKAPVSESRFDGLVTKLMQDDPTMADVIEYLEIKYPHVVVLDSARESAKGCTFQNVKKAFKLFDALCSDYFEAIQSGQPDTTARNLLGSAYRANESDKTMTSVKMRQEREFKMPDGSTRLFEKHLTLGVRRSEQLCMQLYFEIEGEVLYIAYAGGHLTTSSS